MQTYHVEVDSDKTVKWYNNATEKKLHRVDGPAVEWGNGDKEYWLNGKKLSEADHKAATSKDPCNGKLVEIEGKKYKLQAI